MQIFGRFSRRKDPRRGESPRRVDQARGHGADTGTAADADVETGADVDGTALLERLLAPDVPPADTPHTLLPPRRVDDGDGDEAARDEASLDGARDADALGADASGGIPAPTSPDVTPTAAWPGLVGAVAPRDPALRGVATVARLTPSGPDLDGARVYDLLLHVELPDREPYQFLHRQLIADASLGSWKPGSKLSVRVLADNPNDLIVVG